MATQLLLSNKNNQLMKDLHATGDQNFEMSKDTYSYNLRESIQSLPSEWSEVPPNQTLTHGGVSNFNIPLRGRLASAVVKITLRCPTGLTADTQYRIPSKCGLNIFKSLSIHSSNTTLYRQKSRDLLSHLSTMVGDERERAERGLMLWNDDGTGMSLQYTHATTTRKSITFYIPVYAPQFQDPSTWLNTNFLENMSLKCEMNNASDIGVWVNGTVGTAVELAIDDFQLVCKHYTIPENLETALVKEEFEGDNQESLVIYNWESEVETLATCANNAETTITKSLTFRGVSDTMYVQLDAWDTADYSNGSMYKMNCMPVHKLTFKVSGQPLLELSGQYLQSFQTGYGMNSGTYKSGSAVNGVIAIPFSVIANSLVGTEFQGALSFSTLANPQLVATVRRGNASLDQSQDYKHTEVSAGGIGALTPTLQQLSIATANLTRLNISYRTNSIMKYGGNSGRISMAEV